MNQHSPHANLPTLSSTSPLTASRATSPSNQNAPPNQHRRRRVLHPNGTHADPNSAESRDAAARAAKLTIRGKLREDWEWDPAASLLHHLQDENHEDPNTKNDDDTVSDEANPLTWREREMDSSDASESSMLPPWAQPNAQTAAFKFDSPDAVGHSLIERKRKRRRILEDELRWNEGLRTWVLRRDDWTGGRVKVVRHTYTTPPPAITLRHPPPRQTSPPTSTTVPIKTELVPVTTPLLPPTHPIRSNINPQTYPSIYSKVVVQGLAPTVPINLKDMTRALVVGWKEDDMWPPKDTVPEVGIAAPRKKHGDGIGRNGGRGDRERERERGLAKGVGVFKRALGLGAGHVANGLE